ncbi:MAG: hypothetical protein D9V47_08005 [Clostridia bacterium]|nr:MAG: hypothetical protein D9V47_08005 [Clostridia bacterium]
MRKDMQPWAGDILLYATEDGAARIEVFFQDETFWLTMNRMADLFGATKQAISYHLQRIYETNELQREATVKEILTVQVEGGREVSRKLEYYNLDAIIAAKDAEITQTFFKTVQNKLHWAITGQTAAEIIAGRAGADKANMGLTTWKNAPHGKILKSDVSIAKNYLSEPEIKELERIVTMFLDYAENQAARQIPMRMEDWVNKLDGFLQFNEYDILTNAGKVSHEVARRLAEDEYAKFRVIQDHDYESDFERAAKKITAKIRRKKEDS